MQIALDIFLLLTYISILLLLCTYVWRFWIMYVQQKFLSKMDWVLLEIKLPREINKSPEAMEIVANAFLQSGGVAQWYKRNWLGNLVTYFSLEIASLEGDVRFFVRTERKFRELITNNFYSQYPGIEITEADDYVKKIYYDHRQTDVSVWGLSNTFGDRFNLPKTNKERVLLEDKDLEVPADFRMLKTYVDNGLDRDPKEEYKHDTLTPILEWLGSMRKGEYAWYQVIVQDTSKFDGRTFPKTYENAKTHESFTLKELAEERKKQIRTKIMGPTYKKGDKIFDDFGYPKMTKKKVGVDDEGKAVFEDVQMEWQKDEEMKMESVKENEIFEEYKDEIKMINRKLQKPLLRALIRVMYIADSNYHKTGSNVQSLLSVFKQYTGPGFNSFRPSPTDPYDYSWENSYKKRVPWRSEECFESYVEREAFYPHLPNRGNAKSTLGKMFLSGGIDWYSDIYLFKKSLGFRKIFRLVYEGVFHPFEHMAPALMTINLEELASLWHLPGTVATTPGIKRVDSLKSDAPSDLPR